MNNLEISINKGNVVKLRVEDHEHEYSVADDAALKDPLVVDVFGKVIALNNKIVIIGNWLSENDQDVYRVYKKNIVEVKVYE